MPYSVAQHDELVCPQCKQSFVADIWIIVDRAGSPDLMEQLKTDQLHTLEHFANDSKVIGTSGRMHTHRLGG